MPSFLEQFLQLIQPHAERHHFEARIINNLIKISPIGIHTKIFLVLSPRVQDNGMRYSAMVLQNPDASFEIRKIAPFHSITDYLRNNSSNAKRVIEENANRIIQEYDPPRVKCMYCDGYGRWQEGSVEYGDQHFILCQKCRGAGYVTVDI